MLYNDDVNTTNSIIKTGVDAWYKKYMLDYDDYIEDTIYCNNRSQSNASAIGWNPNGGDIITTINFRESNLSKDLSCQNSTDKFSTLNPKAKLTYKIGLMSSLEMNMLNKQNKKDSLGHFCHSTDIIKRKQM